MRVLFDESVPVDLLAYLRPHTVDTVRKQGWDGLDNGELLNVAQHVFDVLITADANMKYQHSLANYDIAVIVLRAFSNRFDDYYPLVPEIWRRWKASSPVKPFTFTPAINCASKIGGKGSGEF